MTWEGRMISMHPMFKPFISRAATCPLWVIGQRCPRRADPTRYCDCQRRVFDHLHGWTVAGEPVLTAEPYQVDHGAYASARVALDALGLRLLRLDGSAYDPAGRTVLLAVVRAGGRAETVLAGARCGVDGL